jgi:hypothetical protein
MASWAGGFISLIQVSPEAPRIFAGLTELFSFCDAAALQAHCRAAGIDDQHFNAFMQYAASFYGNLGEQAKPPPCPRAVVTTHQAIIFRLATPSLCRPFPPLSSGQL